MSSELNHFDELRRIILEGDRENYARQNEQLLKRIDELEKELNDPDKFANVIQQSKDEVIDVLGPVMGKMIKKFITSEIERMKQGIEEKSKAIFSFQFIKQKIRSKFTGISEEELALSASLKSSLLQIFVIEKKSGLLIGEYSPQNILEPDLVAGMLSAIKSFVESAFNQENSELESLEYSSYKILMYNFNRYYFACVLEGFVDATQKAELQDDFLNIADKKLGSLSYKVIDDDLRAIVEKELTSTFESKYGLSNKHKKGQNEKGK
jgi:hypothetical protein